MVKKLLFRAIRNRKLWRVMIDYILKWHVIKKDHSIIFTAYWPRYINAKCSIIQYLMKVTVISFFHFFILYIFSDGLNQTISVNIFFITLPVSLYKFTFDNTKFAYNQMSILKIFSPLEKEIFRSFYV